MYIRFGDVVIGTGRISGRGTHPAVEETENRAGTRKFGTFRVSVCACVDFLRKKSIHGVYLEDTSSYMPDICRLAVYLNKYNAITYATLRDVRVAETVFFVGRAYSYEKVDEATKSEQFYTEVRCEIVLPVERMAALINDGEVDYELLNANMETLLEISRRARIISDGKLPDEEKTEDKKDDYDF